MNLRYTIGLLLCKTADSYVSFSPSMDASLWQHDNKYFYNKRTYGFTMVYIFPHQHKHVLQKSALMRRVVP